MAIGTTAAIIAGVGAAATAASATVGAVQAGKQAKRAGKAATAKEQELARLEAGRQAVINPYEDMENVSGLASDVSGMADDLSGMISNEYANLGVATQAAEFQAEEADLSLANTLDNMQSSGASAGGATALARAALMSKRGISASLQQQEAQNAQLRAKGAMDTNQMRMSESQRLQNLQMSEAQRMQNINMSEAQRMQNADVAGKTFEWNATENRETAQMDRVAGQAANQRQNQVNAQARQTEAIMGGIEGLAGVATSTVGAIGDAKRTEAIGANAKAMQEVK